ncbi:malate dehydrogenase [Candidatus Woesearchaeota archaeon]|nr:malate dehydrogenase [Candidatus Woesearchaeota archaeon]
MGDGSIKVSIIGAGNVGATSAFILAQKRIADEIVMVDVSEAAIGKALDMMACAPLVPFDTRITGTTDYSGIRDSSVVVITAGLARMPGMSREDLLEKNRQIVSSVSQKIREHAPQSIVIVVTNPLDVMAYAAWKETGFPKSRVMGMAGVLDSARLRAFIAAELKVSPETVKGMVLGSHGDSMVPLPELTTVNGKPITQLLSREKIDALIKRTQNAGGEIVNYLKTGSAYYSPAASAVAMIEAITKDKKEILPCSVYAEGEYGLNGVFVGLPAVIGKNGIEKIMEMPLSPEAKALLERSAKAALESIKLLSC